MSVEKESDIILVSPKAEEVFLTKTVQSAFVSGRLVLFTLAICWLVAIHGDCSFTSKLLLLAHY
jgi:hypothetical protein